MIDDGHSVQLLDAEFGPLSVAKIVRQTLEKQPEAVLIGHSGSTSAHPTAMQIARAIKARNPDYQKPDLRAHRRHRRKIDEMVFALYGVDETEVALIFAN